MLHPSQKKLVLEVANILLPCVWSCCEVCKEETFCKTGRLELVQSGMVVGTSWDSADRWGLIVGLAKVPTGAVKVRDWHAAGTQHDASFNPNENQQATLHLCR